MIKDKCFKNCNFCFNGKRGEVLNSIIILIIVVVFVLAIFLYSTSLKDKSKGLKQDILENQIAMFIEASSSGMSFEVAKLNQWGVINDVELKEGKVFVSVDSLKSIRGRSYFSVYDVFVEEEENKFLVVVK